MVSPLKVAAKFLEKENPERLESLVEQDKPTREEQKKIKEKLSLDLKEKAKQEALKLLTELSSLVRPGLSIPRQLTAGRIKDFFKKMMENAVLKDVFSDPTFVREVQKKLKEEKATAELAKHISVPESIAGTFWEDLFYNPSISTEHKLEILEIAKDRTRKQACPIT